MPGLSRRQVLRVLCAASAVGCPSGDGPVAGCTGLWATEGALGRSAEEAACSRGAAVYRYRKLLQRREARHRLDGTEHRAAQYRAHGAFGRFREETGSLRGYVYEPLSERLIERYPQLFLPVGNGGQPPAPDRGPRRNSSLPRKKRALEKKILLFGEYEFRHYPSPRQAKRSEPDRDVSIAIDGPTGKRIFEASEKNGPCLPDPLRD